MLAEYMAHLKLLVDGLDHYKASLGGDPALFDKVGTLLEDGELDIMSENLLD